MMKIFVNLITTIRFIYSLFLPFLKSKISNVAFICNIVLIFLTDFIDGKLARKYNVQTLFGSIMDTIADKTLSIILILSILKDVNSLLPILIFEFIIATINTIGWVSGKNTKVNMIGKLKMWLLGTTIVIGYMNYFGIISYNIVKYLSFITCIIQICVIIKYISSLAKQKSIIKRAKINSFEELKYILFDTEYYANVAI
jgi:phosphatidylglycerophosphate synthase